MCRALLYLGEPVLLDNLLFQPDSALVRQSYMPKMLHMLNLAGFGLRAWDPASADPEQAYAYYSQSLPVFDRNLQNLAQKIRPSCVLAHVRGVAYSSRVEISLQNVHPFHFRDVPLVLAHNGDLADFARIRVLADNQEVFNSGVMKPGDAAKLIELDLKGATILGLLVDDAGDGIDNDHADWAEARFIVAAGTRPQTLNRPPAPK